MAEEAVDNGKQAAPAPVEGAAPAEPVVEVPDKFKKEDGELDDGALLKSYKEVERLSSRTAVENAELKKELDASKQAGVTNAMLSQIAENTKAKELEPDRQTLEEYIESKKEDWTNATDPQAAMAKDLGTVMSGWQEQDKKATMAYADEKFSKQEQDIKALREMVDRTDPNYRENKEFCDKLMDEHKLTLDQAKAMAELVTKAKGPEQPERVESGDAVLGAGRVNGEKNEVKSYLTDQDKADFKAKNYSDEEIAEIEKMGVERLNREGAAA